VKAERIENAVLNAVKNAVLRPQILTDHVFRLAENLLEKGKNAEKEKKKKNLEDKKTRLLEIYLEARIQKNAYLEKKDEIEEKEKEQDKRKKDISLNASYIDKPSTIRNIKYFSDLAKERIDKLQPQELQEFLIYLIDEIKFDSNKMKAKILGHIPVPKKTNDSKHNKLSHSPPALLGVTRNNKIRFKIDVKV